MKKKKNKKIKIKSYPILILFFILSSIYLIKSILLFEKIETTLRYIIISILTIIDLYLLFNSLKSNKKNHIIKSFSFIIISFLFIYTGYNLNKIYSYFSKLNKNIIYSTSIVSLTKNENIDLNNLKGKNIGINEFEVHSLSKELINKYNFKENNTIKNYDGYHEMIIDLYNNNLDLIIIPTNYEDIFSNEEFSNLSKDLKILDTIKYEEVKKETIDTSNIEDSFTILLIGIDSVKDGLENADSFNGDSLVLLTVNTKTLTATMLSIPRDSYIPIACFKNNIENKITHAAANGTQCVIDTLQNYFDIDINYYVKINFTGIVKLVDTLNGILVDVPYNLCEQNSKRQFGKNMVYIEKGLQTLNGEQALALARNRKSNKEYCSSKWTSGYRSDFKRIENQQKIIEAIFKKIKSLSSISDLENLLSVISNNIDTNMSEKTIFSFYDIGKEVLLKSNSNTPLTINKLFLDGTGQMIYDERTKMVLWDYIINQESKKAVTKAMKDNLEGIQEEQIKEFTYKEDENYEKKIIGKGYNNTETYKLVENLVGKNLDYANKWAKENGIRLKIEYTANSNKKIGTIIEQNYKEHKRIDLIEDNTLTIKVVGNTNKTVIQKIDCLENENNDICTLKNFEGKTKNDYLEWANSFSNTIDTNFIYEESEKEKETIISQSEKDKSVKEIIENRSTITIIIAK
ncbi:MAG: LCP family protein [Bacilli bacterium]|nr:LCP family protein [Bacilli bacterium]